MILISSSFIYVSIWIKHQIDSNNFLSDLNTNYNVKNEKFDAWEYSYSDSEKISILYYKSFTWSLKASENLNFSFLNSNSWTLSINNWWPLYFEVYSWSTVYDSWVINDNKSLTLTWNLSLKNLWWFSNFSIFFSNTWIIFPYNYYQIEKTVWWTTVIKEFWKY
jgi:hypothetical protein